MKVLTFDHDIVGYYGFLFDFWTRTIPTGLNTTSKRTDVMKIISDYFEKHVEKNSEVFVWMGNSNNVGGQCRD